MSNLQATLTTAAFLAALACAACAPSGEPAPRQEASAETAAAEEQPSNRIAVPAAVRRNLGLSFAPVEVRQVEATLRIPGALELTPRARREYRTPLRGRIELLVDENEEVAAGTPLFRLQSPTWPELLHEVLSGDQERRSAESSIRLAAARVEEARQRLAGLRERLGALAAVSQRNADLELQAADLTASLPRLEAELEVARTALVNAELTWSHALHRAASAAGMSEAALLEPAGDGPDARPRYQDLEWIVVRAEEAGRVAELSATSGAFLEAAESVVQTVDPSRLRFRGQALQADLGRLEGGQQVRLLSGAREAEGLPADLVLGIEGDPRERTLEVLALPRGAASWARPGATAVLEVVLEGAGRRAFAVPSAAVVRDGLTSVFFRRDPRDPDSVLRTEADLGPSDGIWVTLESGVGPGDEVVLDGVYELKLASQQGGGPQQGGHFHADGSFHEEH